tara:strand:- start:839 stop:1573 length:735 start_codon:yes stop_codon:yes gene_type:complete
LNKEEITKQLKDLFKLNSYEAKTYQSVLEGAKTPKIISNLSRVPLPRIYDILKSLEEKGFVKKKGTEYIAVDPEIALEGTIIQNKYELEDRIKAQRESKNQIVPILKNTMQINDGNQFETLIGVQNIGNKFLEIMKNSDEIIISIRKAFEVKELFLGFLSNIRNNKKLIILTPEDYKISDSDARILRESNVIIRKKSLILLDLLVSNKGDIMIGVPDSSKRPEHTIAIWIKNKEFSESLMKSLS